MKCDDAISRFLELDNRESPPLRVRLHTFLCGRCRAEISMMQKVLDTQIGAALYAPDHDLSGRIMAILDKGDVSYGREISYFKWLFVGFVILSGRVLVTYSDTMAWLQNRFGGSLDIPFNIVLGLALSIYALCFIGTHIDDLKKTINLYFK